MNQLLVLPGQTAEEKGSIRTLSSGKFILGRSFEMMDFALDESGFLFQPRAFFREPLLNGVFNGITDLDKAGSGCGFRIDSLSAH